jgi:hypothetical protein
MYIESTMMYMFVNCICTIYSNACIHQGLNPIPHGNTKVLTTKSLQHFINKDEKVELYRVWHEMIRKFKL